MSGPGAGGTPGALGLSAVLWEVLACPIDQSPVEPDEASGCIRCTSCGREYPITDGIPVMLPNEDRA